jgi:hypothetical protein
MLPWRIGAVRNLAPALAAPCPASFPATSADPPRPAVPTIRAISRGVDTALIALPKTGISVINESSGIRGVDAKSQVFLRTFPLKKLLSRAEAAGTGVPRR